MGANLVSFISNWGEGGSWIRVTEFTDVVILVKTSVMWVNSQKSAFFISLFKKISSHFIKNQLYAFLCSTPRCGKLYNTDSRKSLQFDYLVFVYKWLNALIKTSNILLYNKICTNSTNTSTLKLLISFFNISTVGKNPKEARYNREDLA